VNLLGNATDELRHRPPPRRITIQTWPDGEQVCVAVADNGRGIAPEMAERLFRPFASTKGSAGTGLGLYISRQIARAAGGQLALDPAHAPGARFVCRLPRASPGAEVAAAPVPAAPEPAAADLVGLRVRVVDDEPAIRVALSRFLERRGVQVVTAEDGAAALDALVREEFDVVVADVTMPRVDGLELHEALRTLRPALAARTLLLSGGFQVGEPIQIAVEPDRLLLKPIDLAELARRIHGVARAV
jgi:CheY-like chemotaxis protein